MGATDSREIAIVMFHYSVVIKGIERRLAEMEYNVTIVKEDLEQEALRLAGRVSLMIIYLPPEISGDITITKTLNNMCETITERQQKVLFIGESKYRSDLLRQVEAINGRTWLDRPVDMDVLEQTVTKEIEASGIPGRKKRIYGESIHIRSYYGVVCLCRTPSRAMPVTAPACERPWRSPFALRRKRERQVSPAIPWVN